MRFLKEWYKFLLGRCKTLHNFKLPCHTSKYEKLVALIDYNARSFNQIHPHSVNLLDFSMLCLGKNNIVMKKFERIPILLFLVTKY